MLVYSVSSVLHFDANNNLLLQSYHGGLTDTAMVEGCLQTEKYFASHPPSRIITDFTNVTSTDVSSHTIRTLASAPPKVPVGFDRVLVAPQNSLYGVARMFQILVEKTSPNLRIVRALDEAYRLLGIESAEFSPVEPGVLVEHHSA
jgi:hypothetical protein